MPTRFDRAIASEPLGGGRWRGEISPDYAVPTGPNGGYLAAVLLRAMEQEVADPARAPRSLTVHYLRPAQPGPCEITVIAERSGRSFSTLSARLEQEGTPRLLALAAFATDQPGVADYAEPAPLPDAPPALQPPPDDPRVPPLLRQLVLDPVFGAEPFTGGQDAVVGGWMALAEPRDLDAAALVFFCDVWLPAPWMRITDFAPAPTIDLTIHFRARLPLPGGDPRGPVLARLHSTTSREGLFEEDGSLWAPDGTLLAQSRQLGLLRAS